MVGDKLETRRVASMFVQRGHVLLIDQLTRRDFSARGGSLTETTIRAMSDDITRPVPIVADGIAYWEKQPATVDGVLGTGSYATKIRRVSIS